jgi:hypothetical protein
MPLNHYNQIKEEIKKSLQNIKDSDLFSIDEAFEKVFVKIKVLFTSNAVYKLADYIYEKTQSKKLTRNYLKKLREFISYTLQNFPKAGRPADEIYKSTRK